MFCHFKELWALPNELHVVDLVKYLPLSFVTRKPIQDMKVDVKKRDFNPTLILLFESNHFSLSYSYKIRKFIDINPTPIV